MRVRSGSQKDPVDRRSALTTATFLLLFVAYVGEAPVALDSALYNGTWRSPFVALGWMYVPVPGILLTPFQILAAALVPFCMAASVRRFHAVEMDRALYASVACVGLTALWGLLVGGSAYFAYYQVWRFLLALLVAFIMMSALRSEKDLLQLGKLIVIAALIRATLCIYHYWAHLAAHHDPSREYVISHDDSMLFAVAMQICLVWAIVKGGRPAWRAAILISVWVFYAVVLNDRRIAWVELLAGLPAIYLLIGKGPLRSRFNKWAVIAAIPLAGYVAAGTVSNSPIFAPVHAIASTGSHSDASSLAREEEIRNLLRTLEDQGNPLFGTGWGRPYAMVERAYNNYSTEWILAPYTPHNSTIGLAAFSGLLGIIGIWGVIPVAALLATRAFRRAGANQVLRTAAIITISSLCIYGIHCYGDIGFQSLQGSVLLGMALGVAGRIANWHVQAGAAGQRPGALQSGQLKKPRAQELRSAADKKIRMRS